MSELPEVNDKVAEAYIAARLRDNYDLERICERCLHRVSRIVLHFYHEHLAALGIAEKEPEDPHLTAGEIASLVFPRHGEGCVLEGMDDRWETLL